MLYIIIAAAIAVFDQLFKMWIVSAIPIGGYMALIPGVIHLTYVKNTGAAFSIFTDMRLFLIILTSALIVAVILFMLKGGLTKAEKICLAAVLGGGIGNLIDRLLLGYVVDMFEVEFMNYAIFNVADCFIVAGVIAFSVLYAFRGIKEEREKKKSEERNGD